jgi:6-phospho-3-hexuloisomerase
MAIDIKATGRQAIHELGLVVDRLGEDVVDRLVEAIVASKRIALHGLGREGLMMRAFAMRLFHLGLDAQVVGDMTTPPVGDGDLLLISCGPGSLATFDALIQVAHGAGARVGIVTAQPDGPTSRRADVLVCVPAQTMADDRAPTTRSISVLPMGGLFELSELFLFELTVLSLRGRLGESAESMRARHTNLE